MSRLDDFEQATQGIFQREKLVDQQAAALEAKLEGIRADYEARAERALKRARRIEFVAIVVLTVLACLLPLVLNWWEAGR